MRADTVHTKKQVFASSGITHDAYVDSTEKSSGSDIVVVFSRIATVSHFNPLGHGHLAIWFATL
jgi:hypothetical protein